jgi:N,N'-diacetyllegionaminate synthase
MVNCMSKVIIIAEAGVNHNGDLDLAKQLIEKASEAGADYIKFQTWITDENIDKNAPKAQYQLENDGISSQYEMCKNLELPFSDFKILQEYSEKNNIKFLSTPDDYPSLNFLTGELNLALIKIGSGEITNIPFLRKVGAKNIDVILSTGMSSIAEVETAFNTLSQSGAKSVALLHCTSNYPATPDSVNLKAMNVLETAFKTTVGYSDHTLGSEIAVAAVALGARIIEKHLTLDKSLPGPDHKASLEPEEFRAMVRQIRNVEAALSGSGKKEIQASEVETKKVVTKGLYLRNTLEKGQSITDHFIALKRPVAFIPANLYDMVVNRTVKRTISQGEPLKWEDINFE